MPPISRRHLLGFLGGSAALGLPAFTGRVAEGEAPPPAESTGSRFYRNDREEGRFLSTAGFIHATLKHLRPRLGFDSAMPAERFSAWQNAVRDRLRELVVFPNVPEQPEPERLWTRQREGYQLQKWEAYPEPYCAVPFLMLIPDGISAQSPGPAAICLPGTPFSKESLAGEPELDGSRSRDRHWEANRMAFHLVRGGIVSVALDNPGIGETKDPVNAGRWDEFAMAAVWAGRSYEGISVFHRWSILQWLKRQPWVDPARIAMSGHSLGAKPALLVALLDPSVKAVVWNDAIVDWRHRAVVTGLESIGILQLLPGLLPWFDYPDLMASLAPRPLLVSEGGRAVDIDRVRSAYRLAGAEDRFTLVHYPKYASADQRLFDGKEVPEGLTMNAYLPYANVDPPDHRFRVAVAVPWLKRELGLQSEAG